VVEFQLEAGISDAEALALLGEDVLATTAAGAGGGRGVQLGPSQGVGGDANVLRLDDDGSAGMDAAGNSGAGPGYTQDDAFAAQVRPRGRSVASLRPTKAPVAPCMAPD
jgi:hypothetical protein